MSASVLFAGGIAGPMEERAYAKVCVWCDIPHFMSPTDRQLHEQGAQTSHGMCPAAEARMDAELERALEAPCQ